VNPTALAVLLGAAVVGAVAYVWKSAGGGGGSDLFVMQGDARFWKPELAPKLAAALSQLKATPHSSVERVWVLGPTGTEPALAKAKAIQVAGSVVSTSPNLLGGGGSMAFAQVTPAELMKYADKSAAILPALP
jgi:hypothetical protein